MSQSLVRYRWITQSGAKKCQKFYLFSGNGRFFRKGALFEQNGRFWFSAWFVSHEFHVFQFRTSCLFFIITIHQAETASSDKDILARLKLLRKSNVSSNARCFVKGLHSLSSFMVGIWGEMQFIHLHPTVWFGLCVEIRWKGAIQSDSIQNSGLRRGVNSAMPSKKTHTFAAAFFRKQTTFFFAAKRPFFPTVRGRRNSSSQTLRYCCLLTVNQGVHYSTHPNCVGLSLLVAPFTQSTPLMFDRIDAKIMLITETCLIEQQLMLVFDFVDLLTSRLSNLFLQHSGKGLSQLSCPRHDLPEDTLFPEKSKDISVFLGTFFLHLGRCRYSYTL